MRIQQKISVFFIVMAGFVALSGLANAEITDPQKPFSMLCAPDKATGFNQINGEWEQVNIKPTAYTLIKLSSDNPNCRSAGLAGLFSRPIRAGQSFGCYRFKEVGNEAPGQSCTEEWEIRDGGYVLWTIHCGGLQSIRAIVDGPYVRWSTYFIEDKEKDPNPLFLEVGRCRLLNSP